LTGGQKRLLEMLSVNYWNNLWTEYDFLIISPAKIERLCGDCRMLEKVCRISLW